MRRPCILWIDDEVSGDPFRILLEQVFARFLPDVTLLLASGNDEALQLLEDAFDRVALIIQDCDRDYGRCLCGVPHSGGTDSGRRFHQEILGVQFPKIPVVYCTGAEYGDFPENAVRLYKPFRVELLSDFMRSYLSLTDGLPTLSSSSERLCPTRAGRLSGREP